MIKKILIHSSDDFKTFFEKLLLGQPIENKIDENFVFADLRKNENSAWSLLLMAGYLKVIASKPTERGWLCQLAIPNR